MITPTAYLFDAYGTLFDVHSAIRRQAAAIGPDAEVLSALWRQKQLEYSWTRTLMGRYADFWQLTEAALDFALACFPAVERGLRSALLDAYRRLEAFPDAAPALRHLRAAGQRCAIFTNGTEAMARAAAEAGQLAGLVDAIISVDPIGRFKTHPDTYALACDRIGAPPAETCLVSSNRWDVAGAVAAGLQALWVNRTGQPDEYADLPPTRVISGLDQIEATTATG